MVTLSFTRLAVAVGALALTLTAGAGVASADPALGPIIDTTCSYAQVTSALNAQSPEAAAQFDASPLAQSWLRRFLAAPPSKRELMVQQVQSIPEAGQYLGLIQSIADTCNNY